MIQAMVQTTIKIALSTLVLVSSLSASAASNSAFDAAVAASGDQVALPGWIDRIARVLLYKKRMRTYSDMLPYLGKTRSEVIDLMMADERFNYTVLDFGHYFLQSKVDDLFSTRSQGVLYSVQNVQNLNDFGFTKAAVVQSPAFFGALAVSRGENFYDFFSSSFPNLWAKRQEISRTQSAYDRLDDWTLPVAGLSDRALLDAFRSYIRSQIAAYIAALPSAGQPIDRGQLCFQPTLLTLPQVLPLLGLTTEDIFYLNKPIQLMGHSHCEWFPALVRPTSDRLVLTQDMRQAAIQAGEQMAAHLQRVIDEIPSWPVRAGNESPFALIYQNPTGFLQSLRPRLHFFSDHFFYQYKNSSTNFNRRRSAAVLRTFFCDDLVPIDIIADNLDHGDDGGHASDPGCRACHYRLDPMAGFFRQMGRQGTYFGADEAYIFDDGKVIVDDEYQSYRDQWRSDSGLREWEVGFVRSAHLSYLNQYGESLEDLVTIIKQAKEVKQCMARRLSEYFISRSQSIDGAWLASITAELDTPEGTPGLKAAIKRVVLSKAFTERDPEPQVCYDLPAGDDAGERPPCQVAHLLARSCVSCHNNGRPASGLALDSWKSLQDGQGFAHIQGGNQVTRCRTFASIADRLEAVEPWRRMPMGGDLLPQERADLIAWVNSNLETCPTEEIGP